MGYLLPVLRTSPSKGAAKRPPFSLFAGILCDGNLSGVSRCLVSLAASLALTTSVGAAPDYLRDIKPLLARQCVLCHGPTAKKGDLLLDTARGALAGGQHGPAVVPGKPDASLILKVVTGTHSEIGRMPMKRPPLDSTQTQLLRDWIAAGAQAPAEEVPSSDRHWAFVPPVPPALPEAATSGHPIDTFIQNRLAEERLTPSPEADPAVLFRRLTLDLTGLPPSPTELDAYLADTEPDRYERAVDRLLASPHHGERWARWWLDAARYADSNGYSVDGSRTVWPYRDWVVRAMNADLPFDTFTRWQIAGDLLPGAGTDAMIASGFHRHTQINHEGGIDAEQFRLESIIDRVNTTGTVWLGVSVGCAQCHDHKFDPITQRDYYALFAFFNSTENDGHAASDYNATGPGFDLPNEAEAAALAQWEKELKRLEQAVTDAGTTPAAKDRQKELAAWRKKRPSTTRTLVMRELDKPRETVVFVKGDFTRPGAKVTPATPVALTPKSAPAARNRSDLADWLVSRDNPLTARVAVNRVWQVYFGRGLVETENDFGTMGELPSHPELLDWLACDFRDNGWSLKRLHRLIVTSATYRQASTHRADLAETDARNKWFARQNRLRLEAEQIRDAALSTAGLLDPRIGGPPVFPPQPGGLGAFTQNMRPWVVSKGGDRFRRALYTHLQRSTLHPALSVFDAPDTFTACTRRQRSNTPLQALTLLNDAAFHELAAAFGKRIANLTGTDEQRLTQAFRLATARVPKPSEVTSLARLLHAERTVGPNDSDGWTAVARVLLNLDESITRE